MRYIDDVDIHNKKVILRCDFNVPMENGVIENDVRLKKAIKTINYLLLQGCSIILMSHLGRIKTLEDMKKNSLKPVSKRLSELLNKEIIFLKNPVGDDVLENAGSLKSGELLLLENTRFCDCPQNCESNNDLQLAKYWASLGDIFVIDAFASMHRVHASMAGISSYLPTYYGLLVKEEITNLDYLINDVKHPFTVFMGASKIDDKLKYMKVILDRCDLLLLGGGVANSFLYVLGKDIGESIRTHDANTLEQLQEMLKVYKEKIILPTDFMIINNQICDIGMKTIDRYQDYYKKSNTIFMNGTPGQFERNEDASGTKALFESLRSLNAIKVAGGGATLNAISKFNYENAFTYLSSGGGASLEYISSGKLAAMDYIENISENLVRKRIM